jgi:uncharacterized protein YndB with AHSA1/START domain
MLVRAYISSPEAIERGKDMPFTWKMQIDAPPEAVFDALADMPSHGAWANKNAHLKVSEVSGGQPQLGSKYRSESVFFGKPASADLEIVSFDRPRKFAYSVTHHQAGKPDVHLTHTFTMASQGGGTLLIRSTDGDGSPLKGFLFYPAIKADGKKSLTNLKAKLEGSRA